MKKRSEAGVEWRTHWRLVMAALAGATFAAIAPATTGLFMEPLGQEFGFSRAEVASGLTIYALLAVPLSPLVGALIDRWGSRRLGIAGIILSAASFAAFGVMNGTLAVWLMIWTLYSFFALATKPTVWTAAVSSVFTAGRGLAVAVALSGTAVAQTFAPPAARWLIDNRGWREAYGWVGLGFGAVVLIMLLLFFFDARDHERRAKDPAEAAAAARAAATGLSPKEALRNPAIWRIGAATLVGMLAIAGLSIHQVPILTDQGFSRETAALIAGAGGIGTLSGKLLTGWMLDRWTTPWIPAVSVAAPVITCLLLLSPWKEVALAIVAIAVLGYATGAMVQVCAYLTVRHAGLRNFGKIFGVMASLLAVGVGIGPVASGLIFDHLHSYVPVFFAAIPLVVISGIFLAGLGPYPDWTRKAGAAS